MTDDYDSPWKDVLERYFQDFMAFFFPSAHADIDWSGGYESLDSELWDCETLLRFPVIKLMDYSERWAALEASDNPFAVMVMAHLQTRATRNDPEARLGWKLRLVKWLYEKGYNRDDILELFRFIDWLLALPAPLEQRFQAQLADYEAAMSTPYITSIERRGIEKGIQQGVRQGRMEGERQGLARGLAAERTLLRRLAERRFGEATATHFAALLEPIDDPEQLTEVGEWIIDCGTGEDLLARVATLRG